jgi:hypothetical protein
MRKSKRQNMEANMRYLYDFRDYIYTAETGWGSYATAQHCI